jgi:hypothetical protein
LKLCDALTFETRLIVSDSAEVQNVLYEASPGVEIVERPMKARVIPGTFPVKAKRREIPVRLAW